MAKGYSIDLRARAVALVEDGESRREAARVLGLGASTAIRWMERWASMSDTLGNPPANSVVADSGTMTTCSPISRRNRSAAVVLPPPGPPVRTMRSG